VSALRVTLMAPDERRMTVGRLAFVDGDADNLPSGNLLGLRRRAHSFGGKGRRQEWNRAIGRRSLFCVAALTVWSMQSTRRMLAQTIRKSPTLSSPGCELSSPYGSALVSIRRQASFLQSA
jgi:hypothetical protein